MTRQLLSKHILGNESLALHKKPDSSLEGEGQAGHQAGRALRGDARSMTEGNLDLALGDPPEVAGGGVRSKPGGLWVPPRSAPRPSWPRDTVVGAPCTSGRRNDSIHLAQAFLGKAREGLGLGGGVSHREHYFLENHGHSGQIKALSKVASDALSRLSQKVISNSMEGNFQGPGVFHHHVFLVISSAVLLLRISLLFTILAHFLMKSLSFTPQHYL